MIQSLLFMAGGLPAEYWFRTFQSTAKPCGIATGPSNQIHYLVSTGGSTFESGSLNKYGSPIFGDSRTFDYGSNIVPLASWDATSQSLLKPSPVSDDGSGSPAVVGTASYNTGDPDYFDFSAGVSRVGSSVLAHQFDNGNSGSDFAAYGIDASSGSVYLAGEHAGRATLVRASGSPWHYRPNSSVFTRFDKVVRSGSYVYAVNSLSAANRAIFAVSESTGSPVGSSSFPAVSLAARGGSVYAVSAGFASFSVCKLTSTLGVVWVKNITSGAGANAYACGAAPDSAGNVYVLLDGYSFDAPKETSSLVKIDSSGALVWSRQIHGAHPVAVSVDSSDVPIVAFCPRADNNYPPNTDVTIVARLPADGSGTGTYTLGTATTFPVTYTTGATFTLSTGVSPGSYGAVAHAAGSYSQVGSSVSDAGQTFTSTKKDIA